MRFSMRKTAAVRSAEHGRYGQILHSCAVAGLVSIVAAFGGAADANAQGTVLRGEPFPSPIGVEENFPQLPEHFRTRPQVLETPEALLRLVLEGATGFVYQDNVFRSPTQTESDLIWIAAPRLRLIHDGPAMDGELLLDAEIGRYFEFTEQDYEDIGASGVAVWGDPDAIWTDPRRAYARFGGGVRLDHQAIGADIDDPERQATKITRYVRGDLALDGAVPVGPLLLLPEARARVFDFSSSRRIDGTRIDNDAKDRTEIDGLMRFAWPLDEPLSLLFDAGANTRIYHKEIGGVVGFDRDSVGLRARVGARYGAKDVPILATFAVGIAHQDYEDPRLGSISALGFLGGLEWRISAADRLDLVAERDIGETIIAGASGTIATRARLTYSHQFTAALGMRLTGEVGLREFETNTAIQPIDREDHAYRLLGEVTYQLTDGVFVALSADYTDRYSNVETVEYDLLEIFARVGARF